MANRVTPLTTIELLSGNISAQTYFDNNLGPAFTALNDASLGYLNGVLADTGSANNYVVACNFGTPSAYNQGMRLTIKPANNNTGASNITVSPLTSVSILRPDGTVCIGGEIVANVDIDMTFNGTAFVITALPWLPLSISASISVNTSYNCQNASSVFINLSISTSITVTLNNLVIGVPVLLALGNSTGSVITVKLAATLPGGTPYTAIATKPAGGTAGFTDNWLTTGGGFAANEVFVLAFNSNAGPQLIGSRA